MWEPDDYLDTLYERTVKRHEGLYDERWQRELKNRFIHALGGFSEQRDDLQPETLERKEFADYVRLRVAYTSTGSLRVPAYVLLPKNGAKMRNPAVLALHGHGYGSKEIVGLFPDGSENRGDPGIHKRFAVELVRRGFVVIAPEVIGFGERKLKEDRQAESAVHNSCFPLASRLLLMGKTLPGLRIFESFRALDYLQTLDEVDGERIGCMGLSGGGLIAAFTAALDERIKATVVSGYANTFRGSIMASRHCLDNYIPGILQHAEMPELIGLVAPRPLFVEAGERDPLFPKNRVDEALEVLCGIYRDFSAKSHLSWDIFPGKHEISGRKSFDWLKKTLLMK